MSSAPKISVIMAVHNGVPFLAQAVKSILNQTYKNFEFIIVDDASTDKTWSYLKSLRDKRIKLIKNNKNLGLAKSLNKALDKSIGDYVARMDADDVSLPKRFETQINFLLKNSSIDLCGSWVDLINGNGQIVSEKKYPVTDSQIKKALPWYPSIIHPTFMAKATFFKNLNGYDPRFDLAEEYELLLRGKNKFKFANIPKKLLLWRLWDKRRSRVEIEKMGKVDLRIKIEAFKRGYFGPAYLIVIFRQFLMTYLFPLPVKITIAKIFKLA